MPSPKYISAAELAQHTSERSCWFVIHGKVYDVTAFLADHPGGKSILIKAAGSDATKQFDAFHAASVLDKYGAEFYVGEFGEPPAVVSAAAVAGDSDAARFDENLDEAFGDLIPFGDPAWYTDAESPYYNDSHRRLRARMRDFVDREIMPYCHEWDEAKQVPKAVFQKFAQRNLLSASLGVLPVKYMDNTKIFDCVDASEYNLFHEVVIVDELARCGSGGLLWGVIGGLSIGLPPIILFGSEHLKDRLVRECLRGEKTICLAITEPQAGSDVANLCTTATLSPDGENYIVNGEKKWITNGVFADYFTVAVRTGGDGHDGISLLLIERTRPGVTTRQMKCSGVWSSGTTFISFDNVVVPRSNLIGEENKGFRYIMWNFFHERVGVCVQANRFSRVCLEEAMKYAHKRRTFGQRLVDHQVIRHKLANMARGVEATHAWLEQMVYRATTMGHEEAMIKLGGPAALLKLQCTKTFEFCAREAAQIFGGLAYTRGGQGEKVERLYREVRAYAIPAGSEEIMAELGIKQALKQAKFAGAKL